MNNERDFLEATLKGEYGKAIGELRFTDDQKARLAASIEAAARRANEQKPGETIRGNAPAGRLENRVARKSLAAAAIIATCLILPITAMAASGNLQGFFADITDWRGAVVGTSYEQANEEIAVSATMHDGRLTVTAVFADPQTPPYREAERLGIAAYQILDANGKTVGEGSAASTEIIDGQAVIDIDLGSIERGSYTLIITAFVSEKKADQPLEISGNWECIFAW